MSKDKYSLLAADIFLVMFFCSKKPNTFIMPTESKRNDLAEWCFQFAVAVRDFLKSVPNIMANTEYSKQLLRSSASVGANFIEANEALGARDGVSHLRIARKEAKESGYWLQLLDVHHLEQIKQRDHLRQESRELVCIFSTFIQKRLAGSS